MLVSKDVVADHRPDEPGESRRQFEDEVFPAELAYIEDRRRATGDDRRPLDDARGVCVDHELVGLALSGGGIRSASFGLGFLQSLGRRFRRIDYLSTVSGGGFIGSSITALMTNAFYRTGRADFPFPVERREAEPPALNHLRNNSDYLKPSGPGDLLRLVAVLLRGILLNSLALFPFLLLTCLLVLLVYGQQLSDRGRFDDQIRRIDALLEHHLGDRLDREREIEPLLAVLEEQALLRVDQGKTRGNVVHQLRSGLSFDSGTSSGGPLDRADLITGTGSAEAPYRLTPTASREDLARALLAGDVLQRYEVIEEVDLLARLLEEDGYRHCFEADGGSAEAVRAEPCVFDENYFGGGVSEPTYTYWHWEALIDAITRHDLIRPATDPVGLRGFVDLFWSAQLKGILQALYNAEYLDETVVRRLVDDALNRPAFYAYGWYQARVGQPFSATWTHAARISGKTLGGAIEDELLRLAEPFAEACLDGDEDDRPPCLRPATTPDDVLHLLAFEQLVDEDRPEARWSAIRVWGRSLAPERAADLLEVLYFGEYLDAAWALDALRASQSEAEWVLLAHAIDDRLEALVDDGRGDSEQLADRLTLAREVVCQDLAEILHANDRVDSLDCPELPDDVDELASWLELLWHRLDPTWITHQLYVYQLRLAPRGDRYRLCGQLVRRNFGRSVGPCLSRSERSGLGGSGEGAAGSLALGSGSPTPPADRFRRPGGARLGRAGASALAPGARDLPPPPARPQRRHRPLLGAAPVGSLPRLADALRPELRHPSRRGLRDDALRAAAVRGPPFSLFEPDRPIIARARRRRRIARHHRAERSGAALPPALRAWRHPRLVGGRGADSPARRLCRRHGAGGLRATAPGRRRVGCHSRALVRRSDR